VKTAFVDTSGFYAFLDRDDRFHAEAKRLFLKPKNILHSRLGTGTAGKSYTAVGKNPHPIRDNDFFADELGKIGAPTSPSAHHQP